MDADRRTGVKVTLSSKGKKTPLLRTPGEQEWQKFRQHEKDVATKKPQERKEVDEQK